MTEIKKSIIKELERIVKTKSKYGICFIGQDIKQIRRIIDDLVKGQRESVYDLSYDKDGYYTGEYTLSEYRYMRIRIMKEYTSKDAREDLKFWTQPVDIGHILFLVIPKEPTEIFEFTVKEKEEFTKKFYYIQVGKATKKSD